MESESELIFISEVEFCNLVEELHLLKQFSGTQVQNKYQIVSQAVIEDKYDYVYLDFDICKPEEKIKLMNEYKRIERIFQRNQRNGTNLSFGMDSNRPFLSSELYPTLVVSPQDDPLEDDR